MHQCFPCHVLVVDDEAQICRMLQAMLRKMGCCVSGFTSSDEALEAFAKHPCDYDLMLTDLIMPGMTGIQLAGKIKELRPDIPVLLLTGYGEKVNDTVAEQAGLESVLLKPVLRSVLADAIVLALKYKIRSDDGENTDR